MCCVQLLINACLFRDPAWAAASANSTNRNPVHIIESMLAGHQWSQWQFMLHLGCCQCYTVMAAASARDDVLAKSALSSYKVLTDAALSAITQVHTARAGHHKSKLSQSVGRSSNLKTSVVCLSRDGSRSIDGLPRSRLNESKLAIAAHTMAWSNFLITVSETLSCAAFMLLIGSLFMPTCVHKVHPSLKLNSRATKHAVLLQLGWAVSSIS